MVKLNSYWNLVFEHSVKFERERTIFAVGRDQGDGKTHIFRINDATGDVYALRSQEWQQLVEPESSEVLGRLVEGWIRRIPVYRIGRIEC